MVTALISSGACDGWGLPRRQLLWALPATWRGATALPDPIRDPRERGLGHRPPLTGHVAAGQCPALTARGIFPLAALAVLQRPPTARGVTFVTLEDETGLGNLVLSPAVDHASRAALHADPLVVVVGRVQRRGPVVNLQVASVEPY